MHRSQAHLSIQTMFEFRLNASAVTIHVKSRCKNCHPDNDDDHQDSKHHSNFAHKTSRTAGTDVHPSASRYLDDVFQIEVSPFFTALSNQHNPGLTSLCPTR